LREVKVVLDFFDRIDCGGKRRVGVGLHQHLKTEKAVYRKFAWRQVVLPFWDVKFAIPNSWVLLTNPL
jgi:hypothetical protein